MRISVEWLKRHVDVPVTPHELGHRLTMAGFPVPSIEAKDGDFVLDVEVTSNRPDLLSHRGMAREVGGLVGESLRPCPDAEGSIAEDRIEVRVEATDLCPRYAARVVRGVRVGPSPAWLVRHLEALGQRSVNNVVDVTNFVMLDLGHPLHAFDLAKLRGPRIVVRRAPGETMTAIDGTKLTVGADELAICDAEGPVALAGVMGSLHSEVSASTRDIVLECAVFAPLAIRAASRAHQIRSEASYRFERFVDETGVRDVSDAAARMLADVCGATSAGTVCEDGRSTPRPGSAAIGLRPGRVRHVLGIDVSPGDCAAILTSLGCTAGDAGAWTPPSWRPDLAAEIDLIEEIARRVGFDRVPSASSLSVRPRVVDPVLDGRRRIRDALVRSGLRECLNAPFVGEGALDIALLVDRPALSVQNPMRADEDRLRRSLAGPLLATARRNAERGAVQLRLFESGPVYVAGGAPGTTEEVHLVTGLVTGEYAAAKGCVEAVVDALGIEPAPELVRGAAAPLRADRSATVRVGGEVAGVIGEVSARALRELALTGPVAIFELRSDVLVRAARLERPYQAVSRFPAVERDLAWVVGDDVTWATVSRTATHAGAPLLRSVTLQSVFRGAQLGPGRKSIAFRMELRAEYRTLTGDEADACVRRVIDALAAGTRGSLRA